MLIIGHLQFNALPGALTGREVLHMYARLRGVPHSEIRSTVDELLQRIDLSEYADRCSPSSHIRRIDSVLVTGAAAKPHPSWLQNKSIEETPGKSVKTQPWLSYCLRAELVCDGPVVVGCLN